jgi:hypothetical protein
VRTDRPFVASCFGLALVAAAIAWAIGLTEWQAWLTAAVLAVALRTVYTVHVILPHPLPRARQKRRGRRQPASR